MIEATLSLTDAAARHWQFVVIGAGPGGSATAIRLARAGSQVLLIDRSEMPRAKVCGCCLSPTALRELDSLDALAGGGPKPVPLTAVRIVARGRVARLAMRGGATLSREALDTHLVERAIAAGAHWLPHLAVASLADTAESVCLTARAADAMGSTVMIAADAAVIAAGLADHIRVESSQLRAADGGRPSRSTRSVAAASRVGLGATLPADAVDLPPGELVMAVGRRGYAGIVRLEDGRIDLAAAIDRQALVAAGRPADAIAAILAEAVGTSRLQVSEAALQAAEFRATPALTHRSPLVAGAHERIFRIGDAAGYVEPFTGEGMGWALANARIFSEAILAVDTRHAAAAYGRAHAGLFAAHHARCRGVARAVRHPWVVGGAMRLARLAPRLAARIVPLLIGADRAEYAA